jgi:hypothetical protein
MKRERVQIYCRVMKNAIGRAITLAEAGDHGAAAMLMDHIHNIPEAITDDTLQSELWLLSASRARRWPFIGLRGWRREVAHDMIREPAVSEVLSWWGRKTGLVDWRRVNAHLSSGKDEIPKFDGAGQGKSEKEFRNEFYVDDLSGILIAARASLWGKACDIAIMHLRYAHDLSMVITTDDMEHEKAFLAAYLDGSKPAPAGWRNGKEDRFKAMRKTLEAQCSGKIG